ncbi:hypothetical protein [Paraburkholderia susongensis]|nr:hypothetical protein [Paraburkholderia susongensis]
MLVLISKVPWVRAVRIGENATLHGSNKKARFCVGISGLHVRGGWS